MQKVYVLVHVDAGFEEEVASILRNAEGISKSHKVLGAVDLIAKIEAENLQTARQILYEKIRKIEHVRSTMELPVID